MRREMVVRGWRLISGYCVVLLGVANGVVKEDVKGVVVITTQQCQSTSRSHQQNARAAGTQNDYDAVTGLGAFSPGILAA